MGNGTEHSVDGATAFEDNSYVSVVSESLMSYFESLPKKTIRRLLNDRQLTDFMDDHEDQVFSQKMLTIMHSQYLNLREAISKIVSASQLRQMESLVTFNVSRPRHLTASSNVTTIVNGTRTTRNDTVGNFSTASAYPICQERFDNESRSIGAGFRHLPSVKTVVEMEHVFSHPMIKIYTSRSEMGRILENPNLLRELKSRKNKLLTILFLDMSLISLLDTQIYCFQVVSEESVRIRVGVAFGKTLDAMQLSAIPSYFTHVSSFAKRALNTSDIVFQLVDKNYTSDVIRIDGQEPSPCLFFDLLGSCRNGGHCVGFTGIGNCRCAEGFKGKFCATREKVRALDSSLGKGRWLPFLYTLMAVVLVSVTVVFAGFLVKTCVNDDSDDAEKSGAVVTFDQGGGNGAPTPYQLPRIAVTAASASPSPRPSIGASFSDEKRDDQRGRVDALSGSIVSEGSQNARDRSDSLNGRYNQSPVTVL